MNNKFIPYGKQYIDDNDINSVIETLKSDFLTQGSKINEFEEKLSEYCGSKYAVVFNSGTSALHGAYFSLGLEKDSEFITSPNTFVATSNAGLYIGLKPIFSDININTGNIDENLIEEKINNKTKFIVPVHYAGQSCNMLKIKEIADKYNLKVIEDASHSIGSKYNEYKVGSCKYSDMTILSFHPVKHITSGEGGAVLTNNYEYYKQLIKFRTHGITKDKNELLNQDEGIWYYEMQLLGFNYRMTDIQASLGISQLSKLDSFVKKRRNIAKFYNEKFKNNKIIKPLIEEEYNYHSYHLYSILLEKEYKYLKKEFVDYLKINNIGTQVHYIPVYYQPYYKELGYKKGLCKNSEDFYEREISIPMYFSLTDDNLNYIVSTIENFSNNK